MRDLWQFMSAAMALWAGFKWCGIVAVRTGIIGGRLSAFWLVAAAVYFTAMYLDKALFGARGQPKPRGVSTGGMARGATGLFWRGVMNLILLVASAYVLNASVILLNAGGVSFEGDVGGLAATLLLVAVLMLVFSMKPALENGLSTVSAIPRRARRRSQAGVGGSASFTGYLQELGLRWKSGALLLGTSLYDKRLRIGSADDRHLVTIAGNAAGKGRSVIIPNALTWPHSAVIIDPKGTTAAVTAAARGRGGNRVATGMGQNVYIVDPFGIVTGGRGQPKAARFNALSSVKLNDPTVFEAISSVADALVVPSGGDESHWDNSARGLIRGGIAFVKARNPSATLGDLRDLLTAPEGLPLEDMAESRVALARQAAAQLLAAGDRERGSIISTAIQQTDWLASDAMRTALGASDFDLQELKRRPTTLYLVLPPHYLEVHKRFLRLFVNLALRAASEGGRSRVPIWVCMDEFYSLGRMDSVLKAAANIRSYNVRLHPILQNLSQIEELYPRNWETLLANAGAIQVFGLNDPKTEDYVANKLGRTVLMGDERDAEGKIVRRPVGTALLRDAAEVAREVSRDSERQIVFREGADPLLLRRIKYDEAFPRKTFNRDPDHRRS